MAYIPFVYFTLLLVAMWIKYRKWGVGLSLLAIVDASAFCSALIDLFDLYGDFGCNTYALNLVGVLSYCFLWTFLLCPFFKLDKYTISFVIKKKRLYIYFCWFVIASVFVYSFATNSVFSILEGFRSSGADAYERSMAKFDNMYVSTGRFWLWIPMVLFEAWPLILMCWFLNQIIFPSKKVLNFLILLASFMAVLIRLSGGSRGTALWWILLFVVYYSLFEKEMSRKIRYVVKLIAGLIILLVVGVFIAITVSRFDDVNNNAFYSVLGYGGQMLNNYCVCVEQNNWNHIFPDRVFPLYNFLVNGVVFDRFEYYALLESVYSMQVNVFYTIFGSLLLDVGVVGLMLFLFAYFVLAKLLFELPREGRLDFSVMTLWALMFTVPIKGLFDYPFTGHTQTLYILLSLGLFVIFFREYKIK